MTKVAREYYEKKSEYKTLANVLTYFLNIKTEVNKAEILAYLAGVCQAKLIELNAKEEAFARANNTNYIKTKERKINADD